MKWVDVAQNEEDWYRLRAGRLGGSEIKHVMAHYGKAFSDKAKDLAVKIAIEQHNGEPIENSFSNEHMERGHEEEPIARKKYEDITFCEVSDGGYYIFSDCEGCSPDGLVYDDGLVEIKSRIYKTHHRNWKRGSFDPQDKWQLFYNLRCSGRDWIDYVTYCSSYFKPMEAGDEDRRLFVDRVYRKDISEEINMIEKRMESFKRLIDSNRITNRAA